MSLDMTQTITTITAPRRIQWKIRRFCRGLGNSAGGVSTTLGRSAGALFAGELTGLPHFRQNCAPSGRLVPHLLQAKMAVAAGGAISVAGVLTGCPHFRQNWDPSGRFTAHLLHNTAGSFCSLGNRFGNDSRY
ncbi:hypothetical protein SBA1_1480025 [Candidatus Sulfotelmatobacter kueseliae]|uniref:Uncharacterized protein n=1 Tax=Candidatus Sulfotelmatobacter kueseliae TaxID=2042962 RepID=A0A2U3K8F2_9BACT|nr:hypothetical protein SBA1_1480025 [Candidatus Sulfotelmatobacter kueseliae]